MLLWSTENLTALLIFAFFSSITLIDNFQDNSVTNATMRSRYSADAKLADGLNTISERDSGKIWIRFIVIHIHNLKFLDDFLKPVIQNQMGFVMFLES